MNNQSILISEYNEQLNKEKIIITEDNFEEHFVELVKTIRNSPEFLKLADCTQLIFDKKENREGKDAIYNRQSHTDYVADLSEQVAKKIGLDLKGQKMAYLIGLCHDLGHTAFGHTGENRVNEILKFNKISSSEFGKYYEKKYVNIDYDSLPARYSEGEHSFEHHAHSTRVLRKILGDKDIILDDTLVDELEWGVLCHSESRVAKTQITNPLWTTARYADKFYSFSDILDIIKSGNRIPDNILAKIKGDKEKYKKIFENKGVTIEDKDIENFDQVLEMFFKENAVEFLKQKYVEEAELDITEDGKKSYSINTDKNIGKQMRILQGVATYMRKTGIIGKEEVLADAMVDEIVIYRIEQLANTKLTQEEKVMEACLFITSNTDTELRTYYKCISQDKEWNEKFNKLEADPKYRFVTKISEEDRNEIRKDADIINNYDFNHENKKVVDEAIQKKLELEISEYRKAPSLEKRRELIHKIELAKSGGDPFFKRKLGQDR